MRTRSDGGGGVKSDETLFAILDVLQERGGAGVSEIAGELGVANSTVHRHLTSLHDNEYVVKRGGEYRLGYRFLDLGGAVRTADELVAQLQPHVRQLAEQTGEAAQFIVEEHGRGVYVYREEGDNAVRTRARVGRRFPLHTGSASKAIMAALPEARVREIIDRHGLTAVTDQTVCDEATLWQELETIGEEGVAYNMGENIEGVWAVGAAVTRPDGQVLGGLSVAGPAHRMKDEWFEQQLPDRILGTINEFEITATYS